MNKIDCINLIDKITYDQIDDSVLIKEITPKLTNNRFDLVFKLLYIDTLISEKYSSDYLGMYKDHIRAFSLGSYKEPGNDEKTTIEDYKNIFKSLYDSIKKDGFDENKSLVPLAKDGSILNGAHRTSIAIKLNKKIKVLQTQLNPLPYNYEFFYNRNVPESTLDKVATKFTELSDDTYIAFIWPTAKNYDIDLKSLFKKIVYTKTIDLTRNGAHNLLSQIYEGELWLGDIENNFKGVVNKLIKCFKTFDPVRVVAFQSESLDEVLKIKEEIRKTFNVGKHSIHITDTHEEAIRTARTVFNNNSIHFLNHAQPNKYNSFHNKIEKFSLFLNDNDIPSYECVLDSSITLAAYGIRMANDIDYLTSSLNNVVKEVKGIDVNDENLAYHGIDKNELIHNSDNYFYFKGIKFVSFSTLYKFKKARSEERDINDCLLMEALIEGDTYKKKRAFIKQFMLYKKVLIKENIILITKRLKIHSYLSKFYKKLRNKF